jgi:hypothetical protein
MQKVLHNILFEFGIAMKPFRLIKMCLNETNRIVDIGEQLCAFPIQNDL